MLLRGGGGDLFVASGLSNGPSVGSAAEFMSGAGSGENFRLEILSFINNVRIKVMRPRGEKEIPAAVGLARRQMDIL